MIRCLGDGVIICYLCNGYFEWVVGVKVSRLKGVDGRVRVDPRGMDLADLHESKCHSKKEK